MKHKLLTIMMLCQIDSFSQKDSTFNNHLVFKIAPLVFLGTPAALQMGLETNIKPKVTLGFEYAYGDSKMVSFQSGGAYLDGESSHRFRLDVRFYRNNFLENDNKKNRFWGIELFNRTNFYPTITTIGRSCAFGNGFSNDCSYYERVFGNSTYQVWGVFLKWGAILPINDRLWFEWYGGIGMANRRNIVGDFPLEANDHIFNYDDQLNGRNLSFFDYHKPYGFNRIGVDFLLSAKMNYKIF